MPDPYQHTNTDTGGRMLGVIIHGAIRNVTVSVKMGVNGMPWAEKRNTTESPWDCMQSHLPLSG